MEVAQAYGFDSPAGQGEEDAEFEDRKATTAFLAGRLGKGPLIGRGVGSLERGAVDDFDRASGKPAMLAAAPIGLGGAELQSLLEALEGKATAGLTIGAGGRVDLLLGVESQECLELANDLPTRCARGEDLEEEGPEGAAEREDPHAAVGTFVALREELGREEWTEELLDLGEGGLTDLLDAVAEGREAGTPGGKEWGVHIGRYIYRPIDAFDRLSVQ